MRSRSKITIMAKGTLNNTCNYDSCFCPIPVFFSFACQKEEDTNANSMYILYSYSFS